MARYLMNSVEETMKLGERIGASIEEPVVIRLEGEMGAGKTHFTKGIARGLGIEDDITSPTFSILNVYRGGRFTLFHIDAYRLGSLEEAYDAGLSEVFDDDGVVVLEWGDLLQPFMDEIVIDVKIEDLGGDSREINIEGWQDDSTGN